MIVANGPLYFGCISTPGHHLVDQDLQPVRVRGSRIEWMELLDGRLPTPGQPQGEASLHVIQDWTVLAFWDRSVETRPAGNSIFFIPGIRTGAQALAIARKAFPSVFARFTFEVSLKASGLADALRKAADAAKPQTPAPITGEDLPGTVRKTIRSIGLELDRLWKEQQEAAYREAHKEGA